MSSDALFYFSDLVKQVTECRNHTSPVIIDGGSLSIPAVTVVARYGLKPQLVSTSEIKKLVRDSREVIEEGIAMQKSIYGVTTGIGASANTRSEDVQTLGVGLLQQLHCGILPLDPFDTRFSSVADSSSNDAMPEAWTRGAMLLRVNSMVRGFSGIRWEVIDKLWTLLHSNIVPVVPLRGSISASGDLIPLAYVAGSVIGHPRIRVLCGPPDGRRLSTARDALSEAGIDPLIYQPKEPLALVNGTSFSTSAASLALYDAAQLCSLSVVSTALAVEALLGSRGSFAPFIHDTARPHAGQVQISRHILHFLEGSRLAHDHDNSAILTEDKGILRQDRYPLRTFPQYAGPQIEDIYHAIQAITVECNAASDNPVVESDSKTIHLGGNFQAMSVTNAMEKTRLALAHLSKVVFGQSSELLCADLNKGLAPGLASTNPSVNYGAKGLDIAMAAYVAEMGFLANPVSTHAQFAENFNQMVNSMALVSARTTLTSIDVMTMLLASHLYILCQAVDLRVMNIAFIMAMNEAVISELTTAFSLHSESLSELAAQIKKAIERTMLTTATMDLSDRMQAVAEATIPVMVNFFVKTQSNVHPSLAQVSCVSASIAAKGVENMSRLRSEFLTGDQTTPAASYLGRTKGIYELVRVTLGIRMHGAANLLRFGEEPYPEGRTMGEDISAIYEAIKDGRVHSLVAQLILSVK